MNFKQYLIGLLVRKRIYINNYKHMKSSMTVTSHIEMIISSARFLPIAIGMALKNK